MKTPYTNDWIALDALGPEDEDAELRDYVSVTIEEAGAGQMMAWSRFGLDPIDLTRLDVAGFEPTASDDGGPDFSGLYGAGAGSDTWLRGAHFTRPPPPAELPLADLGQSLQPQRPA